MKHDSSGTYEGTAALVDILIEESKHAYGWRPLRAGLLYALREVAPNDDDDATIYLTPAEFTRWVAEAKALSKARGDGLLPSAILGVSTLVIKTLKTKGVTSKPIALACAHYSMGLAMPVPAGDARQLDLWFRPRFGGTDRVSRWLHTAPKTLMHRLRGYEVRGDDRIDRHPEAYWVRALDWLATVGPICPYGPKAPVDIWPGQSQELAS